MSGSPLALSVRLCTLVGVAVVMSTRTAEAHLASTGLGPIYDGISHLVLTPEDLACVLGMSLLAGLNGPVAARLALFAFTAAWLIGGISGFAVGYSFISSLTAGTLLVVGGLAAADRRLPNAWTTALAVGIGFVHGSLNGAAIAEAQRESLALIGIVSAVFVVVTLCAALVISSRAAWLRVVFRVAGSWIAAIGLLMLGWSLRGA